MEGRRIFHLDVKVFNESCIFPSLPDHCSKYTRGGGCHDNRHAEELGGFFSVFWLVTALGKQQQFRLFAPEIMDVKKCSFLFWEGWHYINTSATLGIKVVEKKRRYVT